MKEKRNMTIDDLSKVVNIASGFLGLIERGQRGTIIKKLCMIFNFFNIALDELRDSSLDYIIVYGDDDIRFIFRNGS